MKASVSVVMPVFNGIGFIESSLPPLLEMRERGEVQEVIVVDDGSDDGSASVAAELGAKVMASGGRRGPGAARNEAASVAQGEILWFVDADVVVHEDAARKIRRVLEDPDTIAVFGSYDDSPAVENFASQYKNLVHHYYHHRGRREASTFWAGCGAVRRDVFLTVGGFDEKSYPRPSIEDIELGYRLGAAGHRIVLDPDIRGKHLKAWTLKDVILVDIFRRGLPWSRLMVRRSGLIDDLNVGKLERIRAAIACSFWLSLAAALVGALPWWLAAASLLIAFAVNKELFLFFRARRGAAFAVAGVLFHQVYYLYSTSVYVWCWLENKVLGLLPGR